jgi:NADPH:quinone reductase-like Zn-dependent oxidoreductase
VKAVRVHELGGPEVLRHEEVDDPTPKAGEVLVKMQLQASTISTSTIARVSLGRASPPPAAHTGAGAAGTVVQWAAVTAVKSVTALLMASQWLGLMPNSALCLPGI